MAKEKTPPIQRATAEWMSLKAKVKDIEKRQAVLKPIIESALREAEKKSFEYNGWRFSLVEFEKENFNLGKAREKLDGRVLAPYITTSNVLQIRTSWQGANKKLGVSLE